MPEIDWQAVPAEAHNGNTVIITTRPELERVRDAGKHRFRVDVSLDYDALEDGMPDDASAATLETITEALLATTAKDKAVVLSSLATGDGRRDWVMHTTSLFIFQKVFNRALEALPLYPLLIEAREDPDWEDYAPIYD